MQIKTILENIMDITGIAFSKSEILKIEKKLIELEKEEAN